MTLQAAFPQFPQGLLLLVFSLGLEGLTQPPARLAILAEL